MSTVSETLKAASIKLRDFYTGEEEEQTGASVTVKTEVDFPNGIGNSKEARFSFNPSASANASRYVLRSYNGNARIFVTGKSISMESIPSRSPLFPDGAVRAADISYGSPYFSVALLNDFQSLSLNAWKTIPSQFYCGLLVGSTGTTWASTRYTGAATLTFAGVASENPPEIDVTWGDVTPAIIGKNKGNGAYVDEKIDNVFSWDVANLLSQNGTPINATTVMKWRIKNDATIHTETPVENAVTIPANTFPTSGTLEWTVLCTTEYGISNVEEWREFTTTAPFPQTPQIVSPKDSIVRIDETTRFIWNPGFVASGADVEYSTDGTTWTTLATIVGSARYTDVPAGTLPAGTLYWRVRSYNNDGVSGYWSTVAQIIGKGTPPAPVINNLDTTPRASVAWQHSTQVGWRVIFEDSSGAVFDSGIHYGTQKTYRSPGYLSDGTASVTVSVANADGQWASTTETFDVENVPDSEIVLNVIPVENGSVQLQWSTGGAFDKYYVLRNGKPIAKTTETTYTDRNTNGSTEYQIRGAAGDNYTISSIVTIEIRTKVATIRPLDGEPIALFIRRGVPPAFSINRNSSVSYQHFAGAEYPTAFDGGFRDLSFALDVTVKNDAVEAVRSLVGELCVLKDKTGLSFFAVVDSVAQSTAKWSDISIGLTRVEYNEEVVYD